MRWTLAPITLALTCVLSCTLSLVAQAQQPAGQAQAQAAQPAGAETASATKPAAAQGQIAMIAPLRCAEPIARIASAQGLVELRDLRTANWQRAQLNDALCLNDNIRVGPNSRASFQYTSDVTVQLDQNTFVTLVEAKDKVSIWTQMWRGALHFITRSRKPFRVITPFANASVEGTEVYIALAKDRADMTVFEGKLDVANDAGQVLLSGGESAVVQGLEAITDDDQFRTLKAQAPQRVLIAKPRDAVQWALYYPPVIDVRAGDSVHPNLKAASEQFRAGNTAEAFAELDKVPADSWDAQYFVYRASLLLYVGREQEAQAELAQALQKDDARKSDVLALQTIIAIVQNDKERGLSLAQQAVQADPSSSAAQIALSYAQQAIFKLEAALQSAEQAATLNPGNALAYARIAEMQLSRGDLDKALVAARKAAELNPNLARTQSILGFSYLTRIDTKNAKETFTKAIQLDSADPLPHLGLGLAKIREGKLEEGRQDIEQAVILDPNNSLIRSYVGKAYYEEKRDELAGKQFEIAKELDPKDPTPFFYQAIRKQAENRSVEAIQELDYAMERNSNRAAYRSKFLLEEDRAARLVNFASLYRAVGMNRFAVSTASASVNEDPGNYSAHRYLSELFRDRGRHEIVRVSELLQSQLLQPIFAAPILPQLAFHDLGSPVSSVATQAAAYEYGPLFEQDRFRAVLGGAVGNRDLIESEIAASTSSGKVAISLGRYTFGSDGYRPNSDLKHVIYNFSTQFAPNPWLSVQAEYRKRETDFGDIALQFAPDFFSREDRNEIFQETKRIGFTFRPAPNSAVLVSLIRNDRTDKATAITEELNTGVSIQDSSNSLEIQAQSKREDVTLEVGAGHGEVSAENKVEFDWTPLLGFTCLPPDFVCDAERDTPVRQSNVYAYANFAGSSAIGTTLGVSYDEYREGTARSKRWQPKLGLRWRASSMLELRAAAFRVLRRRLSAEQTLEPTQIMGFAQFYDDINGSESDVVAIGANLNLGSNKSGALEFVRRTISVTTALVGSNLGTAPPQRLDEHNLAFDFNWQPNARATIFAGVGWDRFAYAPSIPNITLPTYLRTVSLPLGFTLLLKDRLFVGAKATSVWQKIERLSTANVPVGKDHFTLIDVSAGFRLPNRIGTVSLDIENLFDTSFSYQDDNFRSDVRLPQYQPVRRARLKFSLVF